MPEKTYILCWTHINSRVESYKDIVVNSSLRRWVGKGGRTITSHIIVSDDERTSKLLLSIPSICHIVAEKMLQNACTAELLHRGYIIP